VAVKESAGNADQALDMLAATSSNQEFSLLSGDDSMTLPFMAAGAKGVVSVASNVAPKDLVALVSACAEGDFNKARSLQSALLPLMRSLFVETNPQPIKAAMEIAGYAAGPCRLPLLSAKESTKEQLSLALKQLRLI
jgi:4-hydroxy-tetrahydrodipicolinate synthase